MRTTAPAAEDDLVARLQARLGAEVLVQHGLPVAVPREIERVYLVGVEDLSRGQRTQQGARRENYTLPVVVEVERAGGTPQARLAARARGWEVIGELEAELADDPELADVVDGAELLAVREFYVLPRSDNTGWIARALVHVAVEATV